MSQTVEGQPSVGVVAGNTTQTLAGKDRDVAVTEQTEAVSAPSVQDIIAKAADLAKEAAEYRASTEQQHVDTANDVSVRAAFDTVSATDRTSLTHADDFLDDENTFDVSRKEFSELQDAFLRLVGRIENFNKRSPHVI